MILLELFLSFFKIGLFTIGGGYAMLPLIQQEIIRYGWLSPQEFVDIVGIAEMTPGPIAVNAATFVGFRSAGVWGSLTATAAVVLPSFISVLLVSKVWEHYQNSHVVGSIFAGIRPTVAGLVGGAALTLGSTALQAVQPGVIDIPSVVLAVVVFAAVHFSKADPIKVLIVSAAAGLIIFK